MLFSGIAAAKLVVFVSGRTDMAGGGAVRWEKINELITRATAETSKATMSAILGQRGEVIGNRGRLLQSVPELLRDLRIAEILFVEVKQMQAQPMLHLALAQIVQVRLPVAIVR